MVRKLNPYYTPPAQQPPSNMQYPSGPQNDRASSPYDQNQWQRPAEYPQHERQQSHSPYPPAYTPQSTSPTPYGAPRVERAENQDYYRPYNEPSYPPNQQYPPQGYPPYNNGSQSPYPPQQYGYQAPPFQAPAQVSPYGERPYGSPTPPTAYPQPPYGPEKPAYGQGQPPYAQAQPPSAQDKPPYAPSYTPPAGKVPQTEEERGIMGALAGGAAGGFAGHKLNHGFIGALGGAYAGHKLEDKYKEHHNKPKPASPAPASPAPPPIPMNTRPPQYNAPPPVHAPEGNFSASSHNATLDKDFDLIAECTAVNGQRKLSSISLNNFLTNEDGHFKWVGGGGNFGASARNVRLVEGGRWLEAELCDCAGNWRWDRVHLDDKITNNDGDLRMV